VPAGIYQPYHFTAIPDVVTRENLSSVITNLDPRIHKPLKSMDPREEARMTRVC